MLTAALLCGAAAACVWPARRRHRTRGLARTTGGSNGPTVRPRIAVPPGMLPWTAAGGAGVAGTFLGTMLVGVLAAGCAALGARAWNERRRGTAEDAALDALPEGLAALAAELRGGRSLEAATGTAVVACTDERVGRALAEAVRLPEVSAGGAGGELDRALARLSSAVQLSARTGCSLAAVVGAVEDDLRARRRHRRELRSATAGPRASAALLAGLPLLGLAMGSGVGADPWRVLTTTPAGQVLLVVGVALEVAGVAWCGRLARRALR